MLGDGIPIIGHQLFSSSSLFSERRGNRGTADVVFRADPDPNAVANVGVLHRLADGRLLLLGQGTPDDEGL